MTCKILKGFKNKKDYSFYTTFSLFLAPGGTDLCNPASHLEQDCLQYQVLSAVALAAQSLISAVGVHVPTFWVTCSSSGYPPSPVFSIISNLNLIIHSLWSLPANTKRSHHHNSHSNPVGRSLQNLASISLFYFFFCSGITPFTPWHCY